ncbi:DUF262 domain-containing protein [Leuconostoc sp. JNUCC 76]
MTQIRNDYEIVTVADIVQWYKQGKLELSAKYQRNKVWNENARSYLIDSILRGFPIPPIFMRKSFNVENNDVVREIIDGQQRITAIIDFLNDDLTVLKSHNSEYYSTIYSNFDDSKKEEVLSYKISSGIITEHKDSLIYEMFARLNSNNYVLNKQEIRNSIYWGPFKVFVYSISGQLHDFFDEFKIFKDRDFSRMNDAAFVNSLIIFLLNGYVEETPKFIDNVYKKYDVDFDNVLQVKERMFAIIQYIELLFNSVNRNIEPFDNKNYLFTLFATIAEQNESEKYELSEETKKNMVKNFRNFISLWSSDEKELTPEVQNMISEFKQLNTRRTTSKLSREKRVIILRKILFRN